MRAGDVIAAEDVPSPALVRDGDGTFFHRRGAFGQVARGAGAWRVWGEVKKFHWFRRGLFELVAQDVETAGAAELAELGAQHEARFGVPEFGSRSIMVAADDKRLTPIADILDDSEKFLEALEAVAGNDRLPTLEEVARAHGFDQPPSPLVVRSQPTPPARHVLNLGTEPVTQKPRIDETTQATHTTADAAAAEKGGDIGRATRARGRRKPGRPDGGEDVG